MDGAEKRDVKFKRRIIISAVLSLIAVIYIIYHIVSAFKPKTSLYVVTYTDFYDTEVFSGYIFKDDAVLLSGSVGTVDRHFSDGEKVAVGANVADVYKVDSEEAEERLKTINSLISVLDKSTVGESVTVESFDAKIAALRLEISAKTARGELIWVNAHKEELSVLMNCRELAANGKTDFSSEIAALKTERAGIISSLGGISTSVITETSGYYFSYCDGYEGKLSSSLAMTVTTENFDEITSANKTSYSNSVGSLVTDFRWYFICKTTIEKAEGFYADSNYKCSFVGNSCSDEMTLKLEYKSINYEKGEAVLCFFSSYIPSGFDMTRFQQMKVLRETCRGLRVPSSAVRVIDGQTCVYIFKKGIARARAVNILKEQDGSYLVDGKVNSDITPIALNDLVILDDTNLYEGKIVG